MRRERMERGTHPKICKIWYVYKIWGVKWLPLWMTSCGGALKPWALLMLGHIAFTAPCRCPERSVRAGFCWPLQKGMVELSQKGPVSFCFLTLVGGLWERQCSRLHLERGKRTLRHAQKCWIPPAMGDPWWQSVRNVEAQKIWWEGHCPENCWTEHRARGRF